MVFERFVLRYLHCPTLLFERAMDNWLVPGLEVEYGLKGTGVSLC